MKQLEKTDPKYQFDMEILMNLPPVDGDKNNSLIKLGQKIGEAVTDQKIPLFGGSHTTDAAKFLVDKPDDFPMIIFGPGNQSLHSSNEYIDESMYFNFIEIYKQLMIEGLK
ncbi:M20/M25/M40 family metallo-hydrolase [Fructilactobacillus sanfranciscensis]|nr:M20/M25/M40 family metallo-hydrolase [Fructilactobacillus sanfranciscensis]